MTVGSAKAQAPNAILTTEKVLQGLATPQDNKVLIEQRIYAISYEQQYGKPEFLVKLAGHESVFLKYPKILDSNDKYSMGLFHFQQSSFDRFCWHKYFIGNDIYDIDTQIKCVIKMDRDGLVPSNWVLSYKKIMSGK